MLAGSPTGGRSTMRRTGAILVTVVAVVLGGCGSSSSKSNTANTSSASSSTTSTSPSGGGATNALPAPCSLLTKADVAPVIGSDAVDITPNPANTYGAAEC